MKRRNLISIVLISLLLTSCGNEPSERVKDAGTKGDPNRPDGSEKPSVAPGYQSEHFRCGQYWTWHIGPVDQPGPCVRWTVTDINDGGIAIDEHRAKDCSKFNNPALIQSFTFDDYTGHVIKLVIDGKPAEIKEGASVFARLYGGKEKVVFNSRKMAGPGKEEYQAFQIESLFKTSWFIHGQNSYLDGVLLQSSGTKLWNSLNPETKIPCHRSIL